MIRSVCLSLSGILLAVVAGCSSNNAHEHNHAHGQQGTPCDHCDYGYVPVKHTSERRVWCIKDGKMLDCQKNPAECPECRKMMHQGPPAD